MELVLEVINEEFVDKPDQWVKGNYNYGRHSASNWIARIDGPDRVYKLKRTFLEKVQNGRRKDYLVADFIPGGYYQIRCEDKAEGVRKLDDYFVCQAVTDEVIILETVTYEEVLLAVGGESTEDPEYLAAQVIAMNNKIKLYVTKIHKIVGPEKARELLGLPIKV